MNPPNAILLDLDNTAYPYAPCHRAGLDAAQAQAATLDERWRDTEKFRADYEQAREAIKDEIGEPPTAHTHSRQLYFERLVETHYGDTNPAAFKALFNAYWEGYFSQMTPDPGCIDLLRTWRANGVRTAWVSNYRTERQLKKLLALGLEGAADFLLTSEDAGAEKPHPAPFRLALTKLRARPDEAWMVGDNLAGDIGGARVLGITGIWFQRGVNGANSAAADYVVRDWFEMRALWERAHSG